VSRAGAAEFTRDRNFAILANAANLMRGVAAFDARNLFVAGRVDV